MAVHLDAQELRNILCHELNGSFENFKSAISDLFTANGNSIPDFDTLLTLENHSNGSRINLHILCGKVLLYRPYQ